MKKKEVIEVVYCGKRKGKGNNYIAADLLKRKLRVCADEKTEYELKSFSELWEMASYLKYENPYALGVIAFRRNTKIMSEGINILSDYDLSIVRAIRMRIKYIFSCFEKFFPTMDDFKDYFVVSGEPNLTPEFKKEDVGDKWRTLLIVKNIGARDIEKIDNIMSADGLHSLSGGLEFKDEKRCFYSEIKCHSSRLKFLAEMQLHFQVDVKTYKEPEDIAKEIKRIEYIKSITRPKKSRKDKGYFVK